MVLYDVILVGFPGPPNVGSSPAEAIAQVFGIDAATAAAMAEAAPTVVRSGVTEEVARKYFGAFRYIGAECEFRIATSAEDSDTSAESSPPGPPPPTTQSLAGPGSVTRSVTGELGPAPSAVPDFVVDLSEVPDGPPVDDAGSWADVALHGTLPTTGTVPDLPDPAADGRFAMDGPEGSDSQSSGLARGIDAGSGEGRSSGRGSQSSGSGRHRPSVAEVRAAWTEGRDIDLASESAPEHVRPAGEEWDRWIDTGLPEADFPSGVALGDGPAPPDGPDDSAGGTRLDAPRQSMLLAQLDARARAERTKSVSTETTSRSDERSIGTDSSAPLFGPPAGERARPTPAAEPAASTPSSRTAATSAPPTEVPRAARDFRRAQSGRTTPERSDED